MEELQASRDFWEDRALDSDCQIQSLRSAVRYFVLYYPMLSYSLQIYLDQAATGKRDILSSFWLGYIALLDVLGESNIH